MCLLTADVSGVDWMVRHGRSLALAVAVKSAPEKLCGKDYYETTSETVLANATADRVSTNKQKHVGRWDFLEFGNIKITTTIQKNN